MFINSKDPDSPTMRSTNYVLSYQFVGATCSSLYYIREPNSDSVMFFRNARQAALFVQMIRSKPEVVERLKSKCPDLPNSRGNRPVSVRWFVREATRDPSKYELSDRSF